MTADMGGVIRELNGKFGTSFAEFERTEEHEQQVLELMGERPTTIAEWSSTLLGFESGFVSREEVLAAYERFRGRTDRGARPTWIPSQERDAAKERLMAKWADPVLDRERARAYRVYGEVMAR